MRANSGAAESETTTDESDEVMSRLHGITHGVREPAQKSTCHSILRIQDGSFAGLYHITGTCVIVSTEQNADGTTTEGCRTVYDEDGRCSTMIARSTDGQLKAAVVVTSVPKEGKGNPTRDPFSSDKGVKPVILPDVVIELQSNGNCKIFTYFKDDEALPNLPDQSAINPFTNVSVGAKVELNELLCRNENGYILPRNLW